MAITTCRSCGREIDYSKLTAHELAMIVKRKGCMIIREGDRVGITGIGLLPKALQDELNARLDDVAAAVERHAD